ncbi:hypothetical protein EDF68_10327 [Ochrobactrum sp. BH3]|nr:hypothetical protein EDF68_10327 [Ochrobactrum sp. BH3]
MGLRVRTSIGKAHETHGLTGLSVTVLEVEVFDIDYVNLTRRRAQNSACETTGLFHLTIEKNKQTRGLVPWWPCQCKYRQMGQY